MASFTAVAAVFSTPELLEYIIGAAAVSLLEPRGAIAFHYGRDATILLLRLKAVCRAWNDLILTSPRCRRLLFLDAGSPYLHRTRHNPFVHTTFQAHGQSSVRITSRALRPVPFLGTQWAPGTNHSDVLFLFVEKKVFQKWPSVGSWRDMMPAGTPSRQAFVGRLDNLRGNGDMWCPEDVLNQDRYAVDRSGLSCGQLYDLIKASTDECADDQRLTVVCSNNMPCGREQPVPLDEMRAWLNCQLDVLCS